MIIPQVRISEFQKNYVDTNEFSNIKLDLASTHSETDSEGSSNSNNESYNLLSYLDNLLFFFSKNLQIGLQNETLAKEFNKKLKMKLFAIYDEEVFIFFYITFITHRDTVEPEYNDHPR